MKNAYERDPATRKLIFHTLLIVLVLALVEVLLRMHVQAGTPAEADSPKWEAVLLARVAFAKLIVAVPAVVLAILGAFGAFIFIDHSGLGPRLLHPADSDDSAMQAAKKRNSGLIFAMLLLGMMTFLAGILR